jgi:hypothetical protein
LCTSNCPAPLIGYYGLCSDKCPDGLIWWYEECSKRTDALTTSAITFVVLIISLALGMNLFKEYFILLYMALCEKIHHTVSFSSHFSDNHNFDKVRHILTL